MKPFSEQLIALRQVRGITQIDLARRAGLSQFALNRIENGREPKLKELQRLAMALTVSIAVLLGEEEFVEDETLAGFPADVRDCFARYLERRAQEVRGLSA